MAELVRCFNCNHLDSQHVLKRSECMDCECKGFK